MQRSLSFILLDADAQSSSSEHEDIVEIFLKTSKESTLSSEAVVVDVPSALDECHTKIESLIGDSFPADVGADISSQNQDVAENFPANSRQCLGASNKSNLSSELSAPDSLQSSSDCDFTFESRIADPCYLENIEPADILNRTEKAQGSNEDAVVTHCRGAKSTTCQVANVFHGVAELMGKINLTINHIDNKSKCVAICVLLAAVLIPITICLLSTFKPVSRSGFVPLHTVKSDESSELMKCKLVLHWKQEKIEQMEIKLEKFLSTFKKLEDSNNEFKHLLAGYQERCTKCEVSLKETEKQLKVLNDLYESSRNKVLELQEMIIEESTERRPFYQQALDKIFGHSTSRKRCRRRSRKRN